jgi:DNA-binding transcriptional ArsR family regulator
MKSQGTSKSLTDLKKKSTEAAAFLRQLSNSHRLLILCILMEGEKSVGDIQESCGASQSAVSQYLKGLRLEGLIDHRREGKKIFYRIIDKKVLQLIQSLYQVFCR